MADTRDTLDFEPTGFFLLRTPALPFEELEAWSSGLKASTAGAGSRCLADLLRADRERLRARLCRLSERPEVREALFVASPSLVDGLDTWRDQPDSKKGRRCEQALVRYVQRMTSRPTPFGLFSGCSLGRLGRSSRLLLDSAGAYRRHTRLDMDYLFSLAQDLERDPELRPVLDFRPNSSLYLAAGRYRYAEARLVGKQRSYHLVAVESTDHLAAVLRRAGDGATVAELARELVAVDPEAEVSPAEAEEFVGELIDSQILVSSLSPAVTGSEPIHELIDRLRSHEAALPVSEVLAKTRDALAQLDAEGAGAPPERYRAVARGLDRLPTEVELARLFQVDAFKPAAKAVLCPRVIAEIERGIDILQRLAPAGREDGLASFRSDFLSRYEDSQEVPLVEVLDEEAGIGFERPPGAGAEASPLLDGLVLPSPPAAATVGLGAWASLLLEKIERTLKEGDLAIEIEDSDLNGLSGARSLPLPDAFSAMASVAAASQAALARGEFQLLLNGTTGPSGARLLGRFCHGDEALRAHVEEHLRAEAELEPDAIFAEVVHLPQGRLGNVLARPLLRRYEIPYLGRSGAPAKCQIPVTDLLVTVSGNRVVLRSARWRRRVVPRLTSAHNFSSRSLGIYRFLCSLQSQGVREGLGWHWGPLERLSFLPRVTSGRLVLARARWRVKKEEIDRLVRGNSVARFTAVQDWRAERRMPRRVLLVDGDNELLVDFDNILSIEAFLGLVKKRRQLQLTEVFPGPDQLCAAGPEGRFVHQILVPFVRRRGIAQPPVEPLPPPAAVCRTFAPGSQWLYAKLYTGSATADRLLCDLVGPLARRVLASGAADQWFFIRYGDPDWHLRLRFHGEPELLQGEVLPRLLQVAAPFLESGQIWRLQLDTYRREVERYGGAMGIRLAERLAHVDSEAVVALLESIAGDDGAEARWRLALRGIDLLLTDLGLGLDAKLEALELQRDAFARELGLGSAVKRQLARRLRRYRRDLESWLQPGYAPDHPQAAALAALERRSRRLSPILAELESLQGAGRLAVPVSQLTGSFVHMFINRLTRSHGRAHELVLYDFLYQLMKSRAARRRQPKAARRTVA